jgi:transcriptional regulator with XRE-family HTH domain
MQVMAVSPTLRRRQLARELVRLRAAATMTIEQAAEAAGVSMSHLSRVERALVGVRLPVVKVLAAAYGADAETVRTLIAITKEAGQHGWWHKFGGSLPSGYATFIGFESDAIEIQSFDTSMVPGLLQTEAYARAVVANGPYGLADEEIARRVEVRLERQRILTRDDPPKVWAILDEAAVRRQVGDRDIHRAQLDHLLALGKRPNFDIQVVPFAAGAHPGMQSSFILLRFADPTDPPVAYIETLVGDLFPEDSVDLDRVRITYDRLRATASSIADSAALIRRVLKE